MWAPAAARLGELRTGAALLGFGLVLLKVLLAGAFTGYARWLSYPLLLGFPLLFFALFAKGLRGATDLGKETTPEAMPKDRRIRLVLAGMLAVAGLILAPRAVADWSAPDFVMLERIDLLTSPDGSLKAALKLPDAVTGETAAPAFRPLAWGVWAAVHALFGMTPAPYGLVSLAFHLGTAAMVFFLVLFYTEGRIGALLAAGLVAFSPLALEAGPGRFALGSSMAAFFLLAAAHRFRAWQISNSPFAPWEATALVALACASHETGLLAAPVLLYLSFARDRLCYRAPQERLEAMVPAAVVTGLFLAAHGLVWLLNRRSVLDLIAGVFTADAGDVFLWRIPYDLLIRLPNVLALAPAPGAGASWALRIFWLLFGALLCGLA
ncbi:MAG: hypothetical protein K8I02_12230, partial [Candidatus Methylomirabilis sp.]|nr:hypothetical protein [Deltaproteobacteria bacterium]